MKSEDIKERRKQIALMVQGNQNISIEELSENVRASSSTIRRDVEWLTKHNRITRHRGSFYMSDSIYEDFEVRASQYNVEKQKIGTYAASLIESGECIYVGAGTTMRQFALSLAAREDLKNLFVVSSAINVASILAADPRFEVFMLPGFLINQEENLKCVSQTHSILKSFHFSRSITGTSGITVTNGVMMPGYLFAEGTRTAFQQASEVIILADHTKFGAYSTDIVCSVDEVDKIIVDRHPKIEAFVRSEPELGKLIEMI